MTNHSEPTKISNSSTSQNTRLTVLIHSSNLTQAMTSDDAKGINYHYKIMMLGVKRLISINAILHDHSIIFINI